MSSKLLDMLAKKSAAIKGATGNREKPIAPAAGVNRYRILPSWRKNADGTRALDEQFFHDFGQHFIKAVGETKPKAVYVCLSKTFGMECPVCNKIEEAKVQSHDDDVINALNEARSGARVMFNVLAVESGEPNTPKILALPPSVASQIFDTIGEWGAEALDLTAGRDFIIERNGTGLATKYAVRVAPKASAVPASVLDKLHNLDEWVKQESEEQQRRAIASVSAVAGLLAAPAGLTTGARPSAASKPTHDFGSSDMDDDALRAVEAASVDATTEAPWGAAAEPAAEPAVAVGEDVDLDALLGGL